MTTTPQICIVDDNSEYRLILEKIFKLDFPSYSVSLLADGHALWRTLDRLEQLPDLIILDRHMPDLDGHQLLLELKKHPAYKKIPVVMMSADATGQEINRCYEACANSFLSKPLDLGLLRDQLRLICRYWLEMNQKSTRVA
ncbi:response regulator [Spirosoma fluviale]|uniref:Response regulator receiver domain-containing protein n=1 Tax=Spirosoma fluviale TaxID=1597977 RepID=A0A286GIX6_9BACT|nr:response regulator [Spirosoma fluviale]SOD95176.1 Response regulator receiver domain-containing protein [Spirosoma fluviale]